MSQRRTTENILNCGYARVAIHSLTSQEGGYTNNTNRQKKFVDLFTCHKGYINDVSYFDDGDGVHDTKFDRGCKEIMKRFRMKWHPTESRHEYLSTFSVQCWRDLSLQMKRKHTLSNCSGCLKVQAKFPGSKHRVMPNAATPGPLQALLPMYAVTDRHVAKDITRIALSSMNTASMQSLGISFCEAIVKYCPEENIVPKPTAAESKKMKRSVMHTCKRHIEQQIGERDALNFLSENQSMNSYKRMCLS